MKACPELVEGGARGISSVMLDPTCHSEEAKLACPELAEGKNLGFKFAPGLARLPLLRGGYRWGWF